MAEWVLAVERAYVVAATTDATDHEARARSALGAIASHYLAVGTPRTLGVILASAADVPLGQHSVDAHRTWFSPSSVRCAVVAGAPAQLGTPATIAEALASDIVCVHAPIAIRAVELRRGTHVNVLAAATIDDDLRQLATVVHEVPGLGALAAGLVDGRQLDELTVFIVGDAAIARSALLTCPR